MLAALRQQTISRMIALFLICHDIDHNQMSERVDIFPRRGGISKERQKTLFLAAFPSGIFVRHRYVGVRGEGRGRGERERGVEMSGGYKEHQSAANTKKGPSSNRRHTSPYLRDIERRKAEHGVRHVEGLGAGRLGERLHALRVEMLGGRELLLNFVDARHVLRH